MGPSADLAATLSALVDGRLTTAEVAGLGQRLYVDPEALREYCEFMDVECLLAWELKSRALAGAPRPPQPATASDAMRGRRLAGIFLLPLALAALGAAALFFILKLTTTASHGAAHAILTATDHARWAMDTPPQIGRPLPDGPLQLLEGSAQIAFSSGAVVAMQGPAEAEVLGSNRLFLSCGRITPFVPESAHGFSVISPTGKVVDLGTEFSMVVNADGQTDVFVIDGAVDVAAGHATAARPVRLTQGFATKVTAITPTPQVTQKPILIDHFDNAATSLTWRAVDPHCPPVVEDGSLWIPIDGGPHRQDPTVQIVLDQDCSAIVGTRSTISFKATLPSHHGIDKERWVALGIDSGHGPVPWAHSANSCAAVLLSPSWQISTIVRGEKVRQQKTWPRTSVFPRGSDAVGPYQVVLTIDDSPASHTVHGGTTLSAMVHGLEFIRDHVIQMGPTPRLAFQTFLVRGKPGFGYAVIDDFSVSIDVSPPANEL